MQTCESCKFYNEEEHHCKAFGGFTFTWPEDTCEAWTSSEENNEEEA